MEEAQEVKNSEEEEDDDEYYLVPVPLQQPSGLCSPERVNVVCITTLESLNASSLRKKTLPEQDKEHGLTNQ